MNNRVKMKTSKGGYGHGGQVPSEGMIAIKIVQPFEAETEDGRRIMINGGQMMMDGGSVTLKSKDDGTRSYGMGGRVKMDLSSNYEHGGQHPTKEEKEADAKDYAEKVKAGEIKDLGSTPASQYQMTLAEIDEVRNRIDGADGVYGMRTNSVRTGVSAIDEYNDAQESAMNQARARARMAGLNQDPAVQEKQYNDALERRVYDQMLVEKGALSAYENGGVTGDPEKKKKENGDDEFANAFPEMLNEVTVMAPQTRYTEARNVTDPELADQIVYDAVAGNNNLLLGEYGANKPTLAKSGYRGFKDLLDADNRQKNLQRMVEDSMDDDRGTGLNFEREFINTMRSNPEMYEMGPRIPDPGRPGKFTNKHFKYDFDSPEYKAFVEEKANEQIQRRYNRTSDMISDALREREDEWSTAGMFADDGSGFVDEDFRNMLKEKGLTFIPDPNNEGKFIIGKAQ